MLMWTIFESLQLCYGGVISSTRYFVPIFTGIVEGFLFHTSLTWNGIFALALIALGSVLHAITDSKFSLHNFHFVTIAMIFAVLIPIIQKLYIQQPNHMEMQHSPIKLERIILSLPVLVCVALIRNYNSFLMALYHYFKPTAVNHILICFAFALVVAVAYYFLLNLKSNTSIAITNTSYKIVLVSTKLYLKHDASRRAAWMGVLISCFGIAWFIYLKQTNQLERNKSEKPSSSSVSHMPIFTSRRVAILFTFIVFIAFIYLL